MGFLDNYSNPGQRLRPHSLGQPSGAGAFAEALELIPSGWAQAGKGVAGHNAAPPGCPEFHMSTSDPFPCHLPYINPNLTARIDGE
jgi:hypothetical protein